MNESPSRREQLREERRRQIVEAALAVFGKKGFYAANVSDVAAEAGVSQGTIYWYFDSKEDLFEAALLSVFYSFGDRMVGTLGDIAGASDRLRTLAQSMVALADEASGLFALFLEYWSSSSKREESGRLWLNLLVEYKDVVVEIVGEGIRTGEFRTVDAEALVWALMAAYDGLAAYVMLMPDLDPAWVSEAFIETLLKGLEAGRGEDDLVDSLRETGR